MLIAIAGAGTARYVDWPEEKKAIDIGSFYADSGKFRSAVGWVPQVLMADGLRRTVAYYREHLAAYLEAPGARPQGLA
jgi:UDP-glucose 4-epimerase